MQNNNQPPYGFQEFDPNKRPRTIRYVPIAANYPVRVPETRSHSFMGQQITKPFGDFQGGDGTIEYPNKDIKFEDLTREQIRELAYMTDREGQPARRRRDFGMRDGDYGKTLPAGMSVPVLQLLQALNLNYGQRKNDARKYDKTKKQNELSWLDDLRMDKILGVNNLEQKIPVDDPNRKSKNAYMDQVENAYNNNIYAFETEQENHRLANQTAHMRKLLNGNRGESTQKDPLTGQLIRASGNANATTREGLELNPIWRNIAQQMAGGGVGPGSMSPEQQTFFATDRDQSARNYFDSDDFGVGAPKMNQLDERMRRPGIGPSELTRLRNAMGFEKNQGKPLPTMGHSFSTNNTRDLFQLPGVVAGIPEPGSTRPSMGESIRANAKQARKEFVDFGREMPLSSKLGLGGIAASGLGAFAYDALQRNKRSRTSPQPVPRMDEQTLMRLLAEDMGPVKGRRLQQLKGRV
jgi:hypothetical protein